jgi:hypothetical protein
MMISAEGGRRRKRKGGKEERTEGRSVSNAKRTQGISRRITDMQTLKPSTILLPFSSNTRPTTSLAVPLFLSNQ